MYDLLILNGYIIDGSRDARKKMDIAINEDKIVTIGDLSNSQSKDVIDAEGLVICPGFIDVHTHSELALMGGNDQYAPLKMGVTTQLTGPDGFSWAPLTGDVSDEMREFLEVFYDYTNVPKEFFEIQSIDGLLTMFKDKIPSNLLLQVPHGSVRGAVLGWEDRVATEKEIQVMESIVEDWMKAGAKAFCTGLEYEPTRHADLNELVRLAKVSASYDGIYVAHQRGYMDNVLTGCNETFAIARGANIPVHISHFTVNEEAEQLISQATKEGIDVSFDMYPYPAGCTHLMYMLPESWQKGPPERILKQLSDKEKRKDIKSHLENVLDPNRAKFAYVGTPYQSGLEGKTLNEVYESSDKDLSDIICDILLESSLQTVMIYHWPKENFNYLNKTFTHDLHMVSTDGIYAGEKPHPRGFGTFPKVIREFVYEKNILTLENAIYKMTGYPAERFHIKQRGLIKEGYYADITIFDPKRVNSEATFENPRKEPEGIDHVIVNGKSVIEKGKIIPGMNGRILH
ncbi:N-acyl-D-amino-acid deacylase family protein [Aquibacillus saliphilus]|uniref:N-acyl-D-amino-acid deacylase family protein n=1 Tax=Aquibacillus saliphilus TaxID=1909422 RepID=UPI001CF0A577|nr:amidohydrolase family protein [Aquibacillus saliphilus]